MPANLHCCLGLGGDVGPRETVRSEKLLLFSSNKDPNIFLLVCFFLMKYYSFKTMSRE